MFKSTVRSVINSLCSYHFSGREICKCSQSNAAAECIERYEHSKQLYGF